MTFKNNLHITLTPFKNETRLLKQTESLLSKGIVENVYISALHEQGLKEHEIIELGRVVNRHTFFARRFPKNILTHLMAYVELAFQSLKIAKNKQVDLLNIHTLALLPIGVFLKSLTGAKLVYDAHELETEVEGLKGIRKKLAKIIESTLIRFVDLTVVVGDEIKKWYVKQYSLTNIITVLNCPKKQEINTANELRAELKIPKGKQIAIYQGGLSEERGIRLLVETFRNNNTAPLILLIMGYGELEQFVKEAAATNENIYFQNAVAPNKVVEYAAEADVGISMIKNSCLSYELCLPNKLFDYLMAKIPIISSDLIEIQKIINEYQVGIIVKDWTESALLDAINEYKALNKQILSKKLNVAVDIFNWEKEEFKYINSIKKLKNA